MNHAKKVAASTDPELVLKTISTPAPPSSHDASATPAHPASPIPTVSQPDQHLLPFPRLMESTADEQTKTGQTIDVPDHSAPQLQQLSRSLGQMEAELNARQTALQQQMAAWETEKQNEREKLQTTRFQLKQQSTQVRLQQQLLQQLQSNLIRSQQASRAAIATLTEKGSDLQTVAALRTLRYEVLQRFDATAKQWKQLLELQA